MEVFKANHSSWTSHLKWNCAKLRYFVHAYLSPRRKAEITIEKYISSGEEDSKTESPIQPAYPNCDLSIWLRSCESETIEPLDGVITGEFPAWIKGSLYRNGPGKQRYGKQDVEHLFDAAGLLHKFTISNGRVTYQSRYVKSKAYLRNVKAKKVVVPEFSTAAAPDPCQTIFHRISSLFVLDRVVSDNAMISVYPLGDELYAFAETPFIHRIDPVTLETTGRENLRDTIGFTCQSSHPHIGNNGDAFAVGQLIGMTGPSYAIVQYPNKRGESSVRNARLVSRVPCRSLKEPSYMHSFSITESYYILVEQPLTVPLKSVLKYMISGTPLVNALKWRGVETRFRIISRVTGEEFPISFSTEAFFFLHTVNAYEIDDHLVIDICCYNNAKMLDCMYIEALKNAQSDPDYATLFRGRPKRFVMPLKARKELVDNLNALEGSSSRAYWKKLGCSIYIEPEELCPLGCETPRIYYERYNGKPYRYFYAISSDVDATYPGALIKVDTKEKRCWTFAEPNLYASEPIFVPHPNAQKEDDGVILSSLIWGGAERRAGVIVLDAATFTELGRAEFSTSGEVPKCLHGYFLNGI